MAEHEQTLAQRLRNGLAEVPGLELLALWKGARVDRVGVAAFNVHGYRHPLLAAILSAEHAIGVRHGCFCAHPLLARLLGIDDAEIGQLRDALRAGRRPALPGAVRASIGLGTTAEEIDLLVDALGDIAAAGPRESYERVPELDEYRPRAYAAGARWSSSRRVTSSARSIAAMWADGSSSS